MHVRGIDATSARAFPIKRGILAYVRRPPLEPRRARTGGNLGIGRSIFLSRTFCKTTPSTADKNYRHVGRASLQQNFLQAAKARGASRPNVRRGARLHLESEKPMALRSLLRAIPISPCCYRVDCRLQSLRTTELLQLLLPGQRLLRGDAGGPGERESAAAEAHSSADAFGE